jgi:hypothetical protein
MMLAARSRAKNDADQNFPDTPRNINLAVAEARMRL